MIDKNLIINKELCISCGACKLACEVEHQGDGCITMLEQENYRFIPKIDNSRCKKCFKCYSACPIHLKRMRHSISRNSFNDEEKKCFVGYSKDFEHRKNAATAGVATQIVIDALNNNTIDAAIMTKGTENGGFEVVLAKNENDIRKCRGSIYRPVDLLSNISKYIMDENITNIAIVGLPCHIHGLKNICNINKELKYKIKFTISIFCKQNKEKEFTEYIKDLTKFKSTDWQITYRGNGWPGYISIKDNMTEKEKNIIFNDAKISSLWGLQTFTPLGCMMCSDPLGEIADISLGDAWLKEYMNKDNIGTELIIINTKEGFDILDKSFNVEKYNIDFKSILISQNESLINIKRRIDKEFYKNLYEYSVNKNVNNIKNGQDLQYFLKNKEMSEKNIFLSINKRVPSKFMRLYINLRQKIYNKS